MILVIYKLLVTKDNHEFYRHLMNSKCWLWSLIFLSMFLTKSLFWKKYFCSLRQYRLRSFQEWDTKLERFWLKTNWSQMKLPNLENWRRRELSKSAKIWHVKSIFYVKNNPTLSDFLIYWRIWIYEHIFCDCHFW